MGQQLILTCCISMYLYLNGNVSITLGNTNKLRYAVVSHILTVS